LYPWRSGGIRLIPAWKVNCVRVERQGEDVIARITTNLFWWEVKGNLGKGGKKNKKGGGGDGRQGHPVKAF